jgi:acyl-CoA synthetase (AMP-forming)/AMP-acid ligase II
MTNLLQPFLDASGNSPNRPWLTVVGIEGEESWTFRQIEQLLRGFAANFRAAGVVGGDTIFIMAGTGAKPVAAFLGAMLIGAVPSMMPPLSPRQDPGLYWQSHSHLIDHVKPVLILAEGDTFLEGRKRLGRDLIDVEAMNLDVVYEGEPTRDDRIAFLQHSSGTTAIKKGVPISHAAASLQLQLYGERIAVSPSDVVISWLPLYHDMGLVACFLLSLFFRLPLVLIDPFAWVLNPRSLLDAIASHHGTLAWMPNFAFNHIAHMVEGERFDLSSLRMLINCSEPCRPESMQRLQDVLAPSGIATEALKVCYAMAETVFAVSQQRPTEIPRIVEVDRRVLEEQGVVVDGNDLRLVSAGTPLSGVQFRIVDESSADLPERRVGEILVAAPFLFSGYNGLPAETARKLAGGFYRTGDRGFVLDGEIYVIGRLDDVVIVNGRKLDANEVEHALAGVEGLHKGRAVAFPVWAAQTGSHGLAVIFEADVSEVAVHQELATRIRERVYGNFAIAPSIVEARPPGWIVKTTSGKISRLQNKKKFLAEVERVE